MADESMDISSVEIPYEEKVKNVNAIASPLASEKLGKKIFKLMKKAKKEKTFLRDGLKEVQRRLRKGEGGILILAGDVTPLDMYSHIPAVCEDKNIPYCFVPSKADLGAAMGKKANVMVLIREHENYKELFDDCKLKIKTLPVNL